MPAVKVKSRLFLDMGIRKNSFFGKDSAIVLLYRVASFLIRSILFMNGGLNVIGKENVPLQGGVIIASNHVSYLDPPLIGAILPRRATFMARKGLFSMRSLRWFIKHYAFPVDREKIHPSTIKEATARLKRGELLVIFPEGRRSETGALLEGKRGVGMITRLSKAVVVPAFIKGSDRALPCNAKWLKRAEITVTFGEPIQFSAVHGEDRYISEDITRRIMDSIGELKKRYEDSGS